MMENLFKHLAVRLWTTAVAGALAALVVLQPLAGALGPGWMILPGVGLFALAFWLSGAVFAFMGRRRLTHLLKEAAVWDRAGMYREADQALDRAAAIVDSYLFSPFSRREPAGRLLARTARFQMARGDVDASSDAVVGAYLQHFPRDRAAAVKWLGELLAGRPATQQTHDIAVRIGAAHADDAAVQRMLAQFYLAERRCDFAALQAYRHVVEGGAPLPETLLADLADLFLAQPRADSLALTVYLAALDRDGAAARLLPAVAACTMTIRPSPLNAPLLERAAAALKGVDAVRCRRMAADFMPALSDRRGKKTSRAPRAAGRPFADAARDLLKRSGRTLAAGVDGLLRLRRAVSTDRARRVAKWAALGLVAAGVAVLAVNTTLHLAANFERAEAPAEPTVVPVTDPFTLQVAAYLKEADARRYVAQLKDQGLDAYWTRASSAGKAWYQVRIAHYKTKAEARAVGEDLKKRQLIGDYYVANYKRPDIP
ncbi:MAG TPA: SPOR domain-containing protein [Desulfosarcina sp.]|nr:SPOR domain-containing protein [Desulfosarcina sp.]